MGVAYVGTVIDYFGSREFCQMVDSNLSMQIALNFANIWQMHRTGTLADYILQQFGYTATFIPDFTCIYIPDLEEGDIENDKLGSFVSRMWMFDDDGLREAKIDQTFLYEVEGEFYTTPDFRYYCDAGRILFSEAFGPHLSCRKVGRLQRTESGVVISDVQILWTYSPSLN